MSASLKLFETPVDMNLFNKILTTNGGSAIKSNSNKITMRHFIFKLIKTFKKDFNKKKRGGVADIYNDSSIYYSTNTSDLTFAKFQLDGHTDTVREVY
jgi:hypothetical protein